MTGILEAIGVGGAAAGEGAAAGGTSAGLTGASAAGGSLTGLAGMGPELSTGAAPAFSSTALPTSQAMALQRAGEMGNPAFAGSPTATMTAATGPASMMNMSSPKGGGGGYGEAMKSLTSGNSGQAAMDLMKIAASRPQSGGTIPSLPARSGGGGTQPSVSAFLKMLQGRSPAMMGRG